MGFRSFCSSSYEKPKIPAIHFNTRFIVTSKEWFGGGMDATPSHEDKKESQIIHDDLKKSMFTK